MSVGITVSGDYTSDKRIGGFDQFGGEERNEKENGKEKEKAKVLT